MGNIFMKKCENAFEEAQKFMNTYNIINQMF